MSKSVLQNTFSTLGLTEEPGLHLCRQAQSAYLIVSAANVTDFHMNLSSCSCTSVNMHDQVLSIYFRVLPCIVSFLPFCVLLLYVRRTREYLFWTIWSIIAAMCIHCAPLPFSLSELKYRLIRRRLIRCRCLGPYSVCELAFLKVCPCVTYPVDTGSIGGHPLPTLCGFLIHVNGSSAQTVTMIQSDCYPMWWVELISKSLSNGG